MKKRFAFLAATAMMAGLLCLQSGTAMAEESTKDSITIGCEAEPYSLSPVESAGAPSARIRRLIAEGLFEINEAGEYVPLLATSWEWEDDTTLIFHLREGVTFSDGTAFTADDVIWTINNSLGRGGILDNYLDTAEKTDDYTVKITFKTANSLCFDKFESQFFPITNQAAYEADGNEFAYNLIGTGPYVLEDWTTGESLTLKRNENYWGDPAKIENVTFQFITEASQRTIEMETLGTDLDVSVNAGDLDYFEGDDFNVTSAAGQFMVELYYNMSDVRKSPVQDLKVRQAIAYALDTDSLLQTYYNGIGEAPSTNINPAYANVYEPGEGTLYAYDIDKAKALMEEAGYADGFKLVCLSDETQQYQDLTEILQAALAPLNIEVEILIRNSTTWYDTVLGKEEWDLCWFSLGDQSPVWAFMHFLGDGEHFGMPDYTCYRNDTFTEALTKASQTNDNDELKELFKTMNECMVEDLPMYSIYVPQELSVAASGLQNYEYRHGMLNVEEMYFN